MFKAGNVTVQVTDLGRAIRFYTETLGLKLRYRAGDEWAEILGPSVIIGLQPTTAPAMRLAEQVAARVSIGFVVDRLAETRLTLEGRGVHFLTETDEETVRIATFCDPDGTPLYLCELNREFL
jgi:catechol 2,3-dioxygenase-like lactoylglutathione lyase family enzyme